MELFILEIIARVFCCDYKMPISVCGNGTMVHLGRDQGLGKEQDFNMPREFKYLLFFQTTISQQIWFYHRPTYQWINLSCSTNIQIFEGALAIQWHVFTSQLINVGIRFVEEEDTLWYSVSYLVNFGYHSQYIFAPSNLNWVFV